MANPEVELFRSTGWTNTLWLDAEPLLDESVSNAAASVELLGIGFDYPKTGAVKRFRSRTDDIEGVSTGKTNFELIVVRGEYEDWPQQQLINRWASVITHEVAHGVRYEHYALSDTKMEHMATEGLAYVTEYLAGMYTTPGMRHRRLAKSELRYNPALGAKFREVVERPNDGRLQKRWATEKTAHAYLSDMELHAIQRVYQQWRQGHNLSDLFLAPAKEVLDI
ncbi:MAG: hypothetical protein ABIV43_01670 [Candidatus Saccharimonadales bacterium]